MLAVAAMPVTFANMLTNHSGVLLVPMHAHMHGLFVCLTVLVWCSMCVCLCSYIDQNNGLYVQ